MNPKIQTLRPDRPPEAPAVMAGDGPAIDAPVAEAKAVGARPPVDPLLGCLSILAGLLERPTSTSALCAGLPMVDEKFTPTLFVRAAERIGIAARLVKRDLGAISAMNLPCVLLLKAGEACVLTALHAGHGADIIRPEQGASTKRIALSELAKQSRGLVLFAKPEYQFDERTQDLGQATNHGWFWGTLARFWSVYAHAIVASIVINFFALASPLFFMNVYDRVVPNNAVETLWVLASGVIAVYLFDFVLRMARGYFVDEAGKGADVILASRVFGHVMGMRYDVRPPSVGAFAANLRDYETLRDFCTSTTMLAFADLPFVFLFIGVIGLLAGPVAFVPAAAVPVVVLIAVFLQGPLKRVVARTTREGFQKNAILIESLEGLDALKTSAAEGRIQRRWEHLVGTTAKTATRARFLAMLASTSALLVQNLTAVLVLVYGVHLIAAGELTTGALVASSLLTTRAMASLSQIAALVMRFNQSMMSLKTLDGVMKKPLERPPGKVFLHRPRLRGQIEFRGVSFKYPNQKTAALHEVSFAVEPGQKVGVIGRIGSGKSTVTRLLTGLYQPTAGSILFDGTDMRQIDPADLRRNIGYAPQDAFLFFGSVKDNICLAAPHADHAAILRASTIAGVEDFVRGHPDGYDMPVGEHGRYLSGGQRECVSIARALLVDPPILIMDEPTGAMDNGGEGRFRSRVAEALASKTLLLVTHRHTMLALVDFLIVVDGGRIVASGPKDKVLKFLADGQIRIAAGA